MDKFQLGCLDTDDLLALREAVKIELANRRQQFGRDQNKRANTRVSIPDFSHKELYAEIMAFNIKRPLEIPSLLSSQIGGAKYYLPALIRQDWSSCYADAVEEGDFYVYAHVDPRKPAFVGEEKHGGNWMGRPFYVGKGAGRRAWDLKRNQGHGLLIKEILAEGYSPEDIVKVIYFKLPEQKALELESKLIYFFGTTYDTKRTHGCLLNLDIPRVPLFEGTMIRAPGKNIQAKDRAVTRLESGK